MHTCPLVYFAFSPSGEIQQAGLQTLLFFPSFPQGVSPHHSATWPWYRHREFLPQRAQPYLGFPHPQPWSDPWYPHLSVPRPVFV